MGLSPLAAVTEACRALAEAKSVDEAKEIRDRAEAMRAYGRQAKNRQLEVDAAEIRFRAERRLGELIQAQKKGPVGLNPGTRLKGGNSRSGGSVAAPPEEVPTLSEAGIEKKLSSRAQKLAAVYGSSAAFTAPLPAPPQPRLRSGRPVQRHRWAVGWPRHARVCPWPP